MAVVDVAITLILEYVFVMAIHLPIWSLALANTLAVLVQVGGLFILLKRRLKINFFESLGSPIRSFLLSLISAGVMFFTLKFFDKSVWVKSLSFVGSSSVVRNLNFENFVLDTRYTVNLIILTGIVAILGCGIYVLLSFLLKSKELYAFLRLFNKKLSPFEIPPEPVTEIETDS
jgi:hypothetical protein